MFENLIKDESNYNLWANLRMSNWLIAKPSELMDRELPSSYPTLCKTILHIWDTQRFWLSLIQKTELAPFRSHFEGNHEDLLNGFIAQSEELAGYVNSLSEAELLEPCELNMPWAKGIRPRFEFIHHCLNHSTYHRGQLVSMGRSLGLTDPPNTDYNLYNLKFRV